MVMLKKEESKGAVLLKLCPHAAREVAKLISESADLVDAEYPAVYVMIKRGSPYKIEVGTAEGPIGVQHRKDL